MKCECGYNEFYARQTCRHDVKVNENGTLITNINIYDSDEPFGPFLCVMCGKEYENLTDE